MSETNQEAEVFMGAIVDTGLGHPSLTHARNVGMNTESGVATNIYPNTDYVPLSPHYYQLAHAEGFTVLRYSPLEVEIGGVALSSIRRPEDD